MTISTPKLLGYRRKSVVRDAADEVSLDVQTDYCQKWLEMRGLPYKIIWYEDIDISGREESNRPGWQSLLFDLDDNDVEGVIAYSFSRMYRNLLQFLAFLDRCEKAGKQILTVKETIDTSSAMGRALVSVLMLIYQLESDQASERMTESIKFRREVLGRHWGPTPFGCDRNEQGQLIPSARTYWLNPITGEAKNGTDPPGGGWILHSYYDALKLIYELYAPGNRSYDVITAALNADGWRFIDRRGNPRMFDRDDVRRSVAYWQLFRGDLPTGKIQNKKGAILAGGHQPVLPVELCDQVGKTLIIRGYGETKVREGQKRFYLLSNILYCGTCQTKMKGGVDHGLEIYRHHGAKGDCPERWVYAEQIETEVLDYLISLIEDTFIEDIRAEAERLTREAFLQDNTNRGRLAEFDRQKERLSRLEELYLDGEIDRVRYNTKRAEINEILSQIEEELYTSSQLTNFGTVIDRLVDNISQLKSANGETQKALINSIFERLEIVGGKVVHKVPRPWAKGFF